MVTPKFPPDLSRSLSLWTNSHMHMCMGNGELVLSSVLLCWFQASSFVPGCEDTEGIRPWAGLQCGRTAASARSNRRCLGGANTTNPHHLFPVFCGRKKRFLGSNCFLEKRNSTADMHFQHLFYRHFVFPNSIESQIHRFNLYY